MKKGLSQVDFAIAVGMFIIMFAFTLLFTTDRITLLKEETEGGEMRNYALTILNDLMSEGNELGLFSKEYRFTVVLNNSQEYLRNQSATLTDLNNELVQINLSQLGITNIDFNSIRVYNSSENAIKCEIDPSTKTIKFSTPIKLLEVKRFYVYFDDDSNFATPFCDTTITGDDNLTEIVEPIEAFEAVQFKKLETFSVYDPDHLVAYYTFDEPFDSTFIDYSNHENTGTFYGENFNDGTVYGANWTEGKFGKALSFDGVDDYVEIPDDDSLNPIDGITITIWLKITQDPNCDSNNNWRSILHKGSHAGTSTGYDIILEQNRKLTLDIGTEDKIRFHGSDYTLPLNEWVFATFTYDSSTNETKIFINGNEISGTYWDTGGGRILGNSNNLFINNPSTECPNGKGSFPGLIDEIRIYNHALSDEKIKSIYENNTFIRDDLVAYWRFDEGDGQTVHDTHHIVYSSNKGGSKYGNALSFDGVDDYVDFDHIGFGNNWTQISVIMFVKPRNYSNAHETLIGCGKWDYNGWFFNWKVLDPDDGTGYFRFVKPNGDFYGTNHYQALLYPMNFELNRYYMLGAVFDGDDGVMKLYLDGNVVKQGFPFEENYILPSAYSLRIDGHYVPADIDEVHIYNRSLNETEVNQLYHNLAKYNQLKNQIPSRYNFHISIISNNETVFNFGPSVPQRGAEIYALDREILLQNNFGKLQPATMYLYLWK
ncbi:MAG: LamG domain-containing protein [Candidatus Aenigmarchaeota archaeon]|nr:LamG domain-containing protein [Candidatus Aenigmarchaeota archaeon]